MLSFPIEMSYDEDTRAGRMLAAGDVRVTITNTTTGEHITIRFKAMLDNRDQKVEGKRWLRVPFDKATHVYIEVPNASGGFPDKVGTFYPKTGWFYADRLADPERVDAAIIAANWLNGETTYNNVVCHEEAYCGKCGHTLTDPVSIERGIGPECFAQETGSKHQTKQKRTTRRERDIARDFLADLTDQSDTVCDLILEELQMWKAQRR